MRLNGGGGMRYRILGPLSVTVDGRDVAITAGRDRIVLAMLLLHAGRVLSVGTLADAVWGADPPATARGQLQTCVSRLRRSLPLDTIRSDPAGYSLTPGPGELDAAEFTRLVVDARERNDAALYRRALDLWRGDAAAGIDAHGVRLVAAVLDQQHVAALESWAELELAAGRERDLIGELSAAVDRFPLRERLSGQLMRVLFRSGRQADALAEYRRVRSALREELGLDPDRELQELHTAMLTGAVTAAPPPRAAPPSPPPSSIRCLPRTVGDFTGRAEVVRRLVAGIEQASAAGPVVVVIDGMAGSGKTTLALHVAALLADRYLDAHLFVDLHGHDAEQPLDPAAALLVLLVQLGVEAERIPPGLVDRIGLWRTELARRRALVLFDNAASSAQLADLLPTGPGSLALVTGRRRLLGLDGAHPEALSVLTPDEAITLLARIAGARVWAEPDAAAEVVRRCGGLPLAIRIAGARLAHRPRWRVADLVLRLGESALPELAAEDRSVASAFAVSYEQLPEAARRVFRLLGHCPANDFDALTAAALTGLPLPVAQDLVDDLVDVHLVEEPEPGVYRQHDLLREFAGALTGETPAERAEAVRGVLDLQLHAAAATNLPAYREGLDRDIGAPAPLRPDLLDALTEPGARLDRERPNLGRYVDAAAAVPGLTRYAWQLPRAAWRFLFVHGYLDDVSGLQGKAREVAERTGDRPVLALVLNYLASVPFRRSETEEATRLVEQSIAIHREVGNTVALGVALSNLAALYLDSGRWTRAIELAHEVRRLPSRRRPGRDEVNVLAMGYERLGRYPEALRYHRLRLLMQMDIGDPTRIGDTLVSIGLAKYRCGMVPIDVARHQLRVGLRLQQRAKYPYGIALAESALAGLAADLGDFAEAVAGHRRAIEHSRQLGDSGQASLYHRDYGLTLLRAGDDAGARPVFEEAVRLGRRSRKPYPSAMAEAGLAECLMAEDPAEARRLLNRARVALAELEALELHDVEKRLLELEGGDPVRSGGPGETMVS